MKQTVSTDRHRKRTAYEMSMTFYALLAKCSTPALLRELCGLRGNPALTASDGQQRTTT
jgi:hypothetical protein